MLAPRRRLASIVCIVWFVRLSGRGRVALGVSAFGAVGFGCFYAARPVTGRCPGIVEIPETSFGEGAEEGSCCLLLPAWRFLDAVPRPVSLLLWASWPASGGAGGWCPSGLFGRAVPHLAAAAGPAS